MFGFGFHWIRQWWMEGVLQLVFLAGSLREAVHFQSREAFPPAVRRDL